MKLELDKKIYETVYSYASHINNIILEKYNNDQDLTFEDHYSFQISSYLLSVINEQLYSTSTALTTFFIYRCLIENIAILKMYEAGDVEESCFALLKDYNYIIEYNMYNKFKYLNDKLFNFEQMKNNYDVIFQKYKDNIVFNDSKELRSILRSRLPWLKNEYSFDELIKMYCPELYDFYKYLSITIHPADPVTLMPILKEERFEKLFVYISDCFIKFASKHINDESEITESIYMDYQLILSGPREINANYIYMEYFHLQGKLLVEISEMIKKTFGENSHSDYLHIYKDILESIGWDKTFGYSELIKCKIKPFFELIAGHDYQLESTNSIKGNMLFGMHSLYNYYRVIGDIDSCNGVINSIIEVFPEFSKEELEKRMKMTLGFLDIKKSVTKFINDYIDNINPLDLEKIPCLEYEDSIDFKDYAKLCYDEANALSHANGYMIASNTGAFAEYFYPIMLVDICIINVLAKIYDVVNCHMINENKNYNKLKYDIDKCIKQYHKSMIKKYELDIKMSPFKIKKI